MFNNKQFNKTRLTTIFLILENEVNHVPEVVIY